MNLEKFAVDVHQNAIDHGFWEKVDPAALMALIHAEWSEALEEYRAGRAMVWYNCNEISTDLNPCDPQDEGDCLNYACRETCEHRGKKPEGIAVELIDGCLRILDVLDWLQDVPIGLTAISGTIKEKSLPELVTELHTVIGDAWKVFDLGAPYIFAEHLREALTMAFEWLRGHGEDPEKLLMLKHKYNKTRPYKHGGKII